MRKLTKFAIKNRFNGEVIVEMEAETLREVVEKNNADLSNANLYNAYLSKVKIRKSQKEDLLKALRIEISE